MANLHAMSRFRLPQRPRFVRELVAIPLEGGVMIDGAGQPYILEGPGTQTLLPRMLPQMDGTRTLDEIRRALPDVPASDVHAMVASLFNLGFVEDIQSNDLVRTMNDPTLAFFCRHLGITGSHRAGWEACQSLKAQEIILLDTGQNSGEVNALRMLLERSGAAVAISTQESLTRCKDSKCFVISMCCEGEDAQKNAALDHWRLAGGGMWLRVVLDVAKGYADLGPLFNRFSSCYQCFHKAHCDISLPKYSVAGDGDRAMNAQFLLSLLSLEVIYLLSSIAPSHIARGFQRYYLPQWNSQKLYCARVPGCAICRPIPVPASFAPSHSEMINTAVVFEDYVGLPFRPPAVARIEQNLAQIGAELGRQFTRLVNCPHISLPCSLSGPKPQVTPGMLEFEASDRRAITIEDLATLLLVTAGIRDIQANGNVRRWTATAGNLGSVELFVLVRQVSELTPGIYFYQSDDHSLAVFQPHRKTPEISDLIEKITSVSSRSLPDMLVVFTGAFFKVAQKYSHFGYRLLNLDAGVALSQLHLAARSLKLDSLTITRWADDAIEQQLNLSRLQQQVTGVAAISRSRIPESPRSSLHLQNGELNPTNRALSTKHIREFAGRPLEEIFELLFEESRLPEDAPLLPPVKVPRDFRSLMPLPPPRDFKGSPKELLERRISVRHYSSDSLSRVELGSMLWTAQSGDLKDWPEEHSKEQPLGLLVLATRVAGLPSGVYGYNPQDHAVGVINSALSTDKMMELFVQPDFASAPAVIWITGNLAMACARSGAFGHRQLLLRAGAAANRLWLAALEMGLGGCIVAGLVSGAARDHLGLDGYLRASLVAFAVGHTANLNP